MAGRGAERGGRPLNELREFLTGEWKLARALSGEHGEPLGEFSGTGTFSPAPAGLNYRESGTLVMGDYRAPAFRELAYVDFDGPSCAVLFADGRPFHELDLRTGHWRTEHPCRADTYQGEFEVHSADEWTQRWFVTGPHKAYVSLTWLTR